MNRVVVVILNYRTPELALEAARSVTPQLGADDAVVIVDNQSGDGSLERIAQGLDARGLSAVRLVQSPENGGFSAGNNLGIRAVLGRAYLLLNSDATLRPHALERLWRVLEDDPDAGLVSPQLLSPGGAVQPNRFRRHTPVSELLLAARTSPVQRLLDRWTVAVPPEEPPSVDFDWTSFAAVLIRREVIEQVGLLDEGFFMYFEDVDFCLRARAAGWRIRHEPQAAAVHLHAASSQLEAVTAARRRRPSYYYAARRRYFSKTLGPGGHLLANTLWTIGHGIARARELVGNKAPHAVERELIDTWLG